MQQKNCYLVTIQFLGFRYSGWQKQPGRKTLEEMILKTFRFVLPGREFKILGAGRTDAKVSALNAAFELFLKGDPLMISEKLTITINRNLPPDIKVVKLVEVNQKFNIIKDATEKEYMYLFSCGEKNHPYSAPFITGVLEELDIDLMIKGAELFVGTHNFKAYTTADSKGKQLIRHVSKCAIEPNDFMQASFFPDTSYVLLIRSEGFLRYQVRMIMGTLFQLGRSAIGLADINASLEHGTDIVLDSIAPASGLHLRSIDFDYKQ